MEPIVLSLCDHTGNMLKPWCDGSYRCIAVDLQDPPDDRYRHIEYVKADVRDYLPPRGEYVACFAFPPCTDLAASGARWWKDKGLGALAEAIEIVEACRRICEWTGSPWMIENPIGALSTHWRSPDFKFDPCDYGDPYTKKTCLWTGGGIPYATKEPN
jgi:hypothetical protein